MKVFIISDADATTLKEKSELTDVEIIASVIDKKLVLTNTETHPLKGIRFTFNEINNRVTMEFQLTSGQSLAIGNKL